MKTRFCLFCNKEFIVKSNYPVQVFCSKKCYGLNKRTSPQPYSIEVECKCGCGTKFLTPDDHYRTIKFVKGHQNSNGTHGRLGYKEPEDHIEYRMKQVHQHFKNASTGIEKELYSYLERVGIPFEKQKQIGRTRPDAFIPSLNLCIYADGSYWHSKEVNKERDKRCESSITNKGYLFLRLNSINNGYNLNIRPLQQYLLQNVTRS